MEYVMLKDVCTINMGQSPSSDSYNDNGDGVPFFQGNADFGEKYPVPRKWCTAPTKMAIPEDILISVRAPIGAMNYAKEECCIGRGLAALTPNKTKVSSKFIFWLLKWKNAELNSKGTGSTFKAIGRKVLEEIMVPDIPLEKQLEYTEILEKVYTVIQMRKIELQKLDNLIKARFVEMFGDLRTNTKGWSIKTFDELSYLITDGEHATPRRSKEGIYLLSARNVLNHSLQLEDVDYIDKEEYARIAKRVIPQKGDILISCSGTVGRCCSILKDIKFQMVRSVALIRFKGEINPVFAEYMITSDYLQEQINGSKTASSQANLFQGKIKELRGVIPPLELQNEFADFVHQVNKSKVVVQKALDEAQLLFDSLMQKYFG